MLSYRPTPEVFREAKRAPDLFGQGSIPDPSRQALDHFPYPYLCCEGSTIRVRQRGKCHSLRQAKVPGGGSGVWST